jgi:hypothetical protein
LTLLGIVAGVAYFVIARPRLGRIDATNLPARSARLQREPVPLRKKDWGDPFAGS